MQAVPLTAESFAGFGDVIEAPDEGRATFTGSLSLDGSSNDLSGQRPTVLSTSRVQPSSFPLRISKLERHPHSSQTFLPLDVSRWIIVVAQAPEPSAVRAFVAGAGVGITIGRGVWHHGLTVVDSAAAFAVVMAKDGHSDDEWVDIDPLTVQLAD